MTNPIFLNLSGRVKGVTVDFFISDSTEAGSKSTRIFHDSESIKFENVKVGVQIEKYFFIKNNSGIATRANMEIKLFKVHEKTQYNSEKKAISSLFADPMKKISNLADRLRMNDNFQGVGFGMEHYQVELPPFSTVVSPFILLAEMWGSYTDSLLVNIEGIDETQVIPLHVDVVDLPVKLYTGKVSESENETDEVAMLRFGSQVQGREPITRKLQLLNTCYMPLQVDWKIFLVDKNDDQLIDINVLSNDETTNNIVKNANRNKASKINIINETSGLSYLKEDADKLLSSNSSVMENKINPMVDSYTSFDYFDFFVDERVPLIKLKLSSHYGEEVTDENKVFYFSDNRITLKPRDKTTINITFNTQIKKCQAYEAVFVGYLTLPQKYLEGEGFKRTIGFDKEPIRFKATANLDAPNLTIEYDNEDLSYNLATGDLINMSNVIFCSIM